MSRKTNKTARVLSLITGGKENEVAEENAIEEISSDSVSEKKASDSANRAEEKNSMVEPKENSASETAEESSGEKTASHPANDSEEDNSSEHSSPLVSDSAQDTTIETVNPDDNTVSDTKEELPSGKFKQFMSERILNNRQRQSSNAPIVEILFNDHDPLSDMIRDQLQAEEAMTDAIKKGGNPMDEEKKNLAPEEEPVQPFVTHDASSGKVKIKTPDGSESDELDYKFVNVFEEIVRSKVLDAMQKFDVCTCDRCIVDVVALTVTNLPAKCIVADKDAIFPLLSYYSSKYATSVQTELVKACVRVKENPHHKL